MSGDVCPPERQAEKARAAVTNGTRALFGDARTAGARRYRDLLREFAAEVGGMPRLAASEQQTVRRLAQLSVELELLEAQRASGAAINAETFVRLVGTQRRLLRDLSRLKAAAASKPNTLAEHIAKTYGPRPAVPA